MAETKKGDGLVKLSRSGGFDAWQFKMQLHLRGLGIFSIVDGSEPAVPNPTAVTIPKNDSNGENESPAPTPAPIDKQALREWREYRTCRDMAVAIIIQGLHQQEVRCLGTAPSLTRQLPILLSRVYQVQRETGTNSAVSPGP